MSSKIGSHTDYFGVIEPYDNDFALTKYTGLIGAIELSGRDPDGLNAIDHAALSSIAQTIYGKLHRNIEITQYYSVFDRQRIKLRGRKDAKCNMLSNRREKFLNDSNLSSSRIVHYFEIKPSENINKLHPLHALKHVSLAAFNQRSRDVLKSKLLLSNAYLVELEELSKLQAVLQDAIREVMVRWSGLCEVSQLNMQQMWAHMRFLASMNQEALHQALNEAIPEEDMDVCLAPGDIKPVIVNEMDALKISGVTNRYVKIAAVRRFSKARGHTLPGLWAASDKGPARVQGNYVIMTRWRPLSEFEKDWLFSRKNSELERQTLDFYSMITGEDKRSAADKQAMLKPTIKKKMDELAIAEDVPDLWGIGQSYICVFGSDPQKVRDTALLMNAAAGDAKINLAWESVSADDAFASFQPGQGEYQTKRNLHLTSSQFAAAALIYRSSPGQPVVEDLQNEEACYVLKSKNGEPFHFSTFVGGCSLLIGIGRIRSGKTFLKNTLATHYQKYGGFYRAVDIDPGTEPIAQLFNDGSVENAGIFRVSNEDGRGGNLFASCEGEKDQQFRIHLTGILMQMLLANDSKELQEITSEEQAAMDRAIDATVRLPKELQSLAALVSKMPKSLQIKFSRWVRKDTNNNSGSAGWYAHLLDADQDAIGSLTAPIGVYNLQALKETPKLLVPVQTDILYRITRLFEDPRYRHLPKLLDVDECHFPIKIKTFAGFLEQKVRTWGKWFGSIQMWTQSPEELIKAEGWEAIRGAATTFIFFADPALDFNVYRKAFPFLSDGELKAIKELEPRREAYIIQPGLNVSKVVVIETEPEQRVLNTSHPFEASLRDKLIKQHGFEKGMQLAVEELSKLGFKDEEEDVVVSRLQVA